MSTYAHCPVCGELISPFDVAANGGSTVYCPLCGTLDFTERFLSEFGNLPPEQRYPYMGALREHHLSGRRYILNDLNDLLRSVSVPGNPIEQIDKLLLSIEKKAGHFGKILSYDCLTDFPEAYARNADEYFHLIQNAHYLLYIEANCSNPRGSFSLKLAGANRLAELHKGDIKSNQVFIAMWFHGRMDDILDDGIVAAIVETGYKPIVMNRREFNSKIDDEIIASIRQSGFLIADVTGHRQNVYFEAGYAKGLGLDVIWTCCESFIKNAHFDTRQYPHILWKDAPDLKMKLINRIRATQPVRIS